ncbi:hypothetical protein Q8F55_007758 [Vanrija albida]|uniref:Pericentrin/AKAP-450 centrosomal targeting domain-containing protein n=1 Tax=Vanrija albida TaxID=181172 RepID=A0ABR3PUF5_9TREE
MAALLETPSRVLRRVQQYEDMELPSLPSFQHELDMESDRSIVSDDYAASNAPIEASVTSIGDALSLTDALFLGNRQARDIPDDYDQGGSSDRLFPPSVGQDLGSRSEGPVYSYEPSYGSEIADTPIPRNIGRRSADGANNSGSSDQRRIPSLSRSEISVTDTEASTPEGRGRALEPSIVEDDIDTLAHMTHDYDVTETQEENDSFVSIASSDDLMTDRRGSRLNRLQRGNTSVPNILLTNTNSPGVSLNLDGRPDAIKIQKHLNLMNKQLLEGNAELAREAEEWREECNRLLVLMKEVGIEVDEDGALVGSPVRRRSKGRDDSLELPSIDTSTLNERLRDMESELQEREETIASLRQQLVRPGEDVDDTHALREKLAASEKNCADLQAGFAKKTEEHAAQFTEICAEFEQQVKMLEDDLAQAKEQNAALDSQAHDEAQRGAASAGRADDLLAQVAALTSNLEDERHRCSDAEADLQRHVAVSREQVTNLEDQLARATDEAARLRSLATETETRQISDLTAAKDSLESDLRSAEAHAEERELVVEEQRSRIAELLDTISQLETQIATDTANDQDLHHQVADLQTDNETIRCALAEKEAEIVALQKQRDITRQELELGDDHSSHLDATSNSIVIHLEDELSDAYREIGRLQHELESAPLRKSTLESRDARIKALETQNTVLTERLQSRVTSTPARWGTDSIKTSTPLVHKALSSLMMPRTPGPMKEFSWLQSTIGDANEPMLRAQIDHLQQELDLANSQLDKNFGRLEEAGLGAVNLSEKLALANDKIAQLEAELRAVARESKKSAASLDMGRTTNERLEEALASVNQQMTLLKTDMRAEKDRLHDETKRLRALVSDVQAKSDHEIDSLGAQMVALQRELDDAVQDGETRVGRLRKERDDLQRVGTSQCCGADKQTLVEAQASAERDRSELVKENRHLRESHASAEQHAVSVRNLEERLRDEKGEAEHLRETIRQRTQALRAAERAVEDLKNQRSQVVLELAQFSDDLGTQQKECAKFGSELEALRQAQAGRAISHKKALAETEGELGWTRDRLSTAMREAEQAQRRCLHLEKQISGHDAESRGLSLEQKQKFKSQTRVLSAQIQYLKAKYAREATFRNALSLQKKFLILLIGGKSRNEQVALREIASMGYELPSSTRPRRTLKGVALAVVGIIRARRLAQQWHTASEARSAVMDRRVSRN